MRDLEQSKILCIRAGQRNFLCMAKVKDKIVTYLGSKSEYQKGLSPSFAKKLRIGIVIMLAACVSSPKT